MSILHKLSGAQGRRDELPNQELAKEIIASKNKKSISELVENLNNKDVQNDCIKVLYEVGNQEPKLIASHLDTFLDLLQSKNNRLQWGAMMALNSMTRLKAKSIYNNLPIILDAVEKGSVITRDNAINILLNLCLSNQFSNDAFDLFIEQLLKSPPNQLPMYAERAIPIINNKNKKRFIDTLNIRLKDIEKESKLKRVKKVIDKLSSK